VDRFSERTFRGELPDELESPIFDEEIVLRKDRFSFAMGFERVVDRVLNDGDGKFQKFDRRSLHDSETGEHSVDHSVIASFEALEEEAERIFHLASLMKTPWRGTELVFLFEEGLVAGKVLDMQFRPFTIPGFVGWDQQEGEAAVPSPAKRNETGFDQFAGFGGFPLFGDEAPQFEIGEIFLQVQRPIAGVCGNATDE
jgi:hypothetical protein